MLSSFHYDLQMQYFYRPNNAKEMLECQMSVINLTSMKKILPAEDGSLRSKQEQFRRAVHDPLHV